MKKTVEEKKIILTHPVSGIERKIDKNIYIAFKQAILQSLKGSNGKTFTELSTDVKKIILLKKPDFKRSIPWYTISIRLDLETKGIVETFSLKGKKLNRLKNNFAR